MPAFDCGRGHLDLLDQLALVGVHRVEPVDHVVLVDVGGGVAQGAERVHRAERLLAPPSRPPSTLCGSSTIRMGRVALIRSIGFSPPVFSLSL